MDDNEIDVEDLMRKIKDEMERSKKGEDNISKPSDQIKESLDWINSNWDIQKDSYHICSHRPLIGKALIHGRKLIHGEVRRYVDPLAGRQNDLNRNIATIVRELARRVEDIKMSLVKVQESLLAQVDHKISLHQSRLTSDIESQVGTIVAAMNEDIENRAWLAGILEKRAARSIDMMPEPSKGLSGQLNYFLFEERFRGSRSDIRGRQSELLDYFDGCRNILDIGCGRGEFLEILKQRNINGRGIDIDEDMVNFCKSQGLDAERIDSVSYLEEMDDRSLDGILIDQVVEHLEPAYLIRMLGLCYKKLIYGGVILIETVNPLSFFSLANFYVDMSHKRPVHPDSLAFILNAAGFRDMDIKMIAPVRDEARLKKIEGAMAGNENKDAINIYNHNIELLNNTIYGPQDYVIIGRK